ncbi:PhoH family protein [Mycetohabitans sp. B8]|uniref:PhoH family protein n=1 Tax=Mycetohabitans sp. B8 TaxID=2841845 RepID=UPI001F024B65|nr:PhoH family protein [Mycetohabitans sp. B8]MCG1042239.1 PhoH family protein [Mycetohabitans sp. B8]
MPLPTAPSKLGNLLSPDEYKAKVKTAKGARKRSPATGHDYDDADAHRNDGAAFGAAVSEPLPALTSLEADNAALRAALPDEEVVRETPTARKRKSKQTAALLQPSRPAPEIATSDMVPAEVVRDAAAPAPVALRETPAPARVTPPALSAAPNTRDTRRRVRTRAADTTRKLFVLDTNVLMHDPSCVFRFEEHDVYLPMITLEELDNHKKGMSEVARNARQVSRTLDALVADAGSAMITGIALSRLGNREAAGRLFFQTELTDIEPVVGLPQGKADNQILGVVRALQVQMPERQVVLVSKDINMRIKAHALGLPAEDYFNDQVLEDKDLLYSGVRALPQDFWTRHGKGMESWQDTKSGTTYYRVTGPLCVSLLINEFVYLEPKNGEPAFHAVVREINGKTALLQTLRDYGHHKNNVWGITARNREQNFALNLLMNPEVDFVTLLGQAGTGKTLMALAAGLAQVLDEKRYNEIIVTRATVPVGEDIGFLPGTEEEKMQPWMGAFDDNLEVLQKTDDTTGEWGRAATQELIRSRLKVKSMNFMRGRTFVDKYVIIDEAQNLTPKQMKTLVTRAGPGTKMICLGNIAQIDTPYLTEGSSGLTYVVDRFKGWTHGGHVTLARGERSRLADYASDVL